MDDMTMVLFGSLDDPFPGDHIIDGFALTGASEFQVVGGEQQLIPMQGLVLKGTGDPIAPDLVDSVVLSFQEAENKKHEEDHSGRDNGDHQETGADAHPESGG